MGKGVGSKMEVDAWNREGRNGEPGGGTTGDGGMGIWRWARIYIPTIDR